MYVWSNSNSRVVQSFHVKVHASNSQGSHFTTVFGRRVSRKVPRATHTVYSGFILVRCSRERRRIYSFNYLLQGSWHQSSQGTPGWGRKTRKAFVERFSSGGLSPFSQYNTNFIIIELPTKPQTRQLPRIPSVHANGSRTNPLPSTQSHEPNSVCPRVRSSQSRAEHRPPLAAPTAVGRRDRSPHFSCLLRSEAQNSGHHRY